jgi:hypothetical protein
MKRTTLAAALAGVTLAVGLALPATAAVATPNDTTSPAASATKATPVPAVQARCRAAITKRFGQLDVLAARTAASTSLSDTHRASITTILTGTRTGLTELQAQIAAASTVDQLKPLCGAVVTDHRVYVLRTPQVDLTIRFDRASAATDLLEVQAASFQQRIDTLKAQGKDTSKAESALATMNARLATADQAQAGRADALLLLTPADYNADTGIVGPFVTAARQAEKANGSAIYWAARTEAALRRLA